MFNRFIFYFAIIVLSISSGSFQWPVAKPRITSTFGESRWNHYHDGIDVTNIDGKIYPLDPGRLLYFWDKSIFPLDNYPGGGNYLVIKYKNSFCSIFMHLLDGIDPGKIFNNNDPACYMGNSGRSYGKHLHFSILDLNKNISINPLAFLPAFKDERGPDISEIVIRIGDKFTVIKNNSTIRLTRHYPLLIKIIDSVNGNERLGVFKIKATFNGKEIFKIDFNKISYSAKGFIIAGKLFEEIYDSFGYYQIEKIRYQNGENRLNIVASDYAGNISEKDYNFYVKLDIGKI